MTDLVVIVPSRERPRTVEELCAAFDATCSADTRLLFAVDDNDPTYDEYVAAASYRTGGQMRPRAMIAPFDSRTMVEALNQAAVWAAGAFEPFALGFMGDDHRPRTVGWDARYIAALRELGTGFVYGNDLLQGENLPTQIAMTSDIVDALGYMAPPVLTHLFVDNFWRDIGQYLGCIEYLDDVVVEHLHPIAGKAEWSPGHERVNAPAMYERDRNAYQGFITSGAAFEAAETVRSLRDAGGVG